MFFCVLARSSYPHLLLSFLRLQLSYLMSPGWATYLRVQLSCFCLQAKLSRLQWSYLRLQLSCLLSPGWATYLQIQMTFLRAMSYFCIQAELSSASTKLSFSLVELYLPSTVWAISIRLQRTYLHSSPCELILSPGAVSCSLSAVSVSKKFWCYFRLQVNMLPFPLSNLRFRCSVSSPKYKLSLSPLKLTLF